MIGVVEERGGAGVEELDVALADQVLARESGRAAERVVDEDVAALAAQVDLEIAVLDAVEDQPIALLAEPEALGGEPPLGAVAAYPDEARSAGRGCRV